jgi:rhodanese-related sulfurtransferase
MKPIKLIRTTALAIAVGVLPAGALQAAEKKDKAAEFAAAVEKAEAAAKKADSVGGEWRDTGKMIKQAKAAAKKGDYDQALKLANTAYRQGELGYKQAMSQKDAGFPDFMAAPDATESSTAAAGAGEENSIAMDLKSVDVVHNGESVTIKRSDAKDATLPKGYEHVGRHCPPFCVQPITVLEGVETIGELEMLDYLKRASGGDKSVLVVDSRGPEWVARGTIPGSVNVPWRLINDEKNGMFAMGGEAETLDQVLQDTFGAKKVKGDWKFDDAKTLVMFCNGIWCGQSSINIKTLAKLGYPTDKLKWYRGGVQDWVSLGLTTVQP